MSQTIVQGEYIFSRQEMVAGFNFLADEKFTFFFSYGAVDRSATGTFAVTGNQLTLKSDKEAGKDFSVIREFKTDSGYSIHVEDDNKYLLTDIRVSFFIGDERHDEYTNSSGIVNVEYPHCDKIYIFHELFPDMATLIKDEKNNNNNFTVTLNPSLGQVSFEGIIFTITNDNKLTCLPNYFMMLEDIEFEKQKGL